MTLNYPKRVIFGLYERPKCVLKLKLYDIKIILKIIIS